MKRHKVLERKDLIGEHKAGHAVQIFSLIVFMIVWILDSFFLHKTTVLNQIIPNVVRVPFGLLFMWLAYVLASRSHQLIFNEHRDPPRIVQTGVYSRLRHPMYVSELLVYFGLILFSPSLSAIAVFLMIIVFFYIICRDEEKQLHEYFGEAYSEYCRQVPMWVPGLRLKHKRSGNEKS